MNVLLMYCNVIENDKQIKIECFFFLNSHRNKLYGTEYEELNSKLINFTYSVDFVFVHEKNK